MYTTKNANYPESKMISTVIKMRRSGQNNLQILKEFKRQGWTTAMGLKYNKHCLNNFIAKHGLQKSRFVKSKKKH